MALTFDTHSPSFTHLVEFFKTLIPKAAIVSKNQKKIFFTFSHIKAYVTKFDLDVKLDKVNPGS